jgi:hypothetical protein
LPGRLEALLRGLSKVHLGPGRIIGLGVDRQDVFPGGAARRTPRWEAPWLLQPRLADRVFTTRRPRASAYDAARPRATTRSASRGKGQRWRPSGAARQAAALQRASACASSWGWGPGRGRSARAASPSATKRWRGRSTGARPPERAAALALSSQPSAALRRRRARGPGRVAGVPRCRRSASCSRASSLSATRYFFLGHAGHPPYG